MPELGAVTLPGRSLNSLIGLSDKELRSIWTWCLLGAYLVLRRFGTGVFCGRAMGGRGRPVLGAMGIRGWVSHAAASPGVWVGARLDHGAKVPRQNLSGSFTATRS